jgi:hypothetical protein
MRIGWLVIATNKYVELAEALAGSIHEYFRPAPSPGGSVETTVFCFTNAASSPAGTERIEIEHQPWPLVTLLRYHTFLRHRARLAEMDYLVYIDADMRLVAPVGTEILGERIAALHPGYCNKTRSAYTYESRSASTACVGPGEGERYYFGALQGGRASTYLADAAAMVERINADLKNNLIAEWWDESHWNRHLVDHRPTKVLTPEYCYVDGYGLPCAPRIRALVKDHEAVRAEEIAGGTHALSVGASR